MIPFKVFLRESEYIKPIRTLVKEYSKSEKKFRLIKVVRGEKEWYEVHVEKVNYSRGRNVKSWAVVNTTNTPSEKEKNEWSREKAEKYIQNKLK